MTFCLFFSMSVEFLTCRWDLCLESVESTKFKDHLSDHIGYVRKESFDGRCKWHHDKAICTYVGSSRHLLLSHLRRHYDTHVNICKYCHVKSYKWTHDLLKHERKCKSKVFEDIVDWLFDNKDTEHRKLPNIEDIDTYDS
eukprot:NODE_418_length_7796_cov_0.461868.p6 type:complete len:140 gc:universal NODE_418_length_7796_cov_0.461868:6045-5626(-)